MNLDLSTPIATEELAAILGSVGSGNLLQGTIYQPLMQLLIAPTQDSSNALPIWELTQKLYANKDGEVELSDEEVKILKAKLETVVFPWLRARLLQALS
jgi:hypothetical protein